MDIPPEPIPRPYNLHSLNHLLHDDFRILRDTGTQKKPVNKIPPIEPHKRLRKLRRRIAGLLLLPCVDAILAVKRALVSIKSLEKQAPLPPVLSPVYCVGC